MIAIVDYGVGNLASAQKAFAAVGARAGLVRDPAGLRQATAVVLPGVGNFGHCSRELNRYGFVPGLREARERGVPFLGICVGMQLLFDGSEEDRGEPGLGFFRGSVVKLAGVPRVPQIGWNAVRKTGDHPGLRDVADGDHFYFVHSYAAEAAEDVEGGDELVFLDITASAERRPTVVALAAQVADVLFIPFTVGGGIGSADVAGEILRARADKVALHSAAVPDPALIAAIADRYGSQATVLSIDARRQPGRTDRWEVVIDGGRVATGRDAIEWAERAVARGAGEILLNSIDRDGTRLGFDLTLTAAIADAVGVPVIASGGASSAVDYVELFQRTGADAGLAASIFHSGELTVGGVKDVLAAAGIPVRPRERALA